MGMVTRMTANLLNNGFYLLLVHGVEYILLLLWTNIIILKLFFAYETLDSHYFALTSHLWMLADTFNSSQQVTGHSPSRFVEMSHTCPRSQVPLTKPSNEINKNLKKFAFLR